MRIRFSHDEHFPNVIPQLRVRFGWLDGSSLAGPLDQFIHAALDSSSNSDLTIHCEHDLRTASRQCWMALSCKVYQACIDSSVDRRCAGYETLDKYLHRLHRFMGCTLEQCEEGSQETLLCVLENIHRVREPARFLSYCRIIATRRQRRAIRELTMRHMHECPFDAPAHEREDDSNLTERIACMSDDAETWVEQQLADQALWSHLATTSRLTVREYTILLQHFKLNKPRELIRDDLSVSQTALDVAIHRALKKLRTDQVVLSWR